MTPMQEIQCPKFKKEEKFHFSKELFSLNFFLLPMSLFIRKGKMILQIL
ncbi:hypothetical protein BSM4216_1931 [Bacillus smithii]|nr:hypothetical protein BSM4216_1931 [Bacillus smithii]